MSRISEARTRTHMRVMREKTGRSAQWVGATGSYACTYARAHLAAKSANQSSRAPKCAHVLAPEIGLRSASRALVRAQA